MEIQQSLGYLLNTSARLIKRRLDMHLKSYGITTAQWAVLKLLSLEDHLSQAEIAEKTNADRATCGAVIDKLISKGLLQKELFENDRRSYRVKILPPAVTIVDKVTLLAENVNGSAVQGLTDTEISQFAKCLNTIISNLGGGIDELDS
ncbi:MarR family winged helix-turn-helix transcriptional regulator [Gorillibacterium massiliense]|uniref:MarR family winged helix-turn-helix transcriptional regulator n=1 Tax=Gorillibacterium massiliense TaxID=1280390 RepID=UPI0005931B2B|nr:MarR family transcriptional regulator [Gorillibacterium massiliense]